MTWHEIWNNYINLQPGVLEIVLRLLCAMLVGLVIGMEREFIHRPAGLRTHILVALGACVVSITGEILFHQYSSLGSVTDPARLSAQVVTGVGFLGAGTIMKEGATVKGLTTAASVWAVACLGIAAGFGCYSLALAGMILILITLTIFESLQHKFLRGSSHDEGFTLESTNISASLSLINQSAQEQLATIFDLAAERIEGGYRITFRASFSGRRSKLHQQRFFDALASAPESRKLQRGIQTGAAI